MPSSSTGGALLARLLADAGVTATTGMVDGSYGDLAVALDDHDISRITPSTEAGAVHIAAARSFVAGTPGVVFAGPAAGLAHALPALADAHQNGARLLVVSTSRRTGVTGPDRPGLVASLDAVAATAGIVKWSARVPSGDRLVELFDAAVRQLWHGRPGVVHLDVPTSVLTGVVPPARSLSLSPGVHQRQWRVATAPRIAAEVAGMLVRARRPILHLGRGVLHSGAEEQVRELVARLDAGVTTTWAGRGIVPEDTIHVIPPTHPGVVDDLRDDADVVAVLGADLDESDWWGQPPHWGDPADQAIIHVDIDPSAVGRNRTADIGIVGDIATVLDEVIEQVDALGPRDTVARRHWLGDHRAAVRRGRVQLNEPLADEERTPIHPATAVVATRLAMPDDTIWVFDGGHTRRWGQFHVPAMQPRSQLGVGSLGMSGGGIGQALGAAWAAPDRQVCVVMGDGAFARQLGELPTSLERGLPIVVVVLVDGYAGPVDAVVAAPQAPHRAGRNGTGATDHGTTATDDGTTATDPASGEHDDARDAGDGAGDGGGVDPADGGSGQVRTGGARVAIRSLRELSSGVQVDPVRYDLVARALGAWGEFVDHPSQLGPALERAREADRTAVVHVSVDRVEHTWTPEAGMFRAQRQPLDAQEL